MLLARKRHVLAATQSVSSGISLVSFLAVPGTPTGVTSSPINTTGANFLVACTSIYTGGLTLSDSKGNTWTPLTSGISSAGQGKIYYVANAIVGAGHTFTTAGSSIYSSFIVYAFSGLLNLPFQVENVVTGTSPLNTGNVTPAINGSLIITMLQKDGFSSAPTINLGFIPTVILGTNSVNMGCAAAYLIQPVAAPINPQWTWTPTDAASSIAVFKRG